MSEHIVTAYDQDLKHLAGKIAEMGGLAETIVNDSITALMRMDGELAQSVILADRRLDALQFQIEDQAVLLIARRQPMAADLRQIVAAMRTCNELERVGDLAKNIAKRVIAIGGDFRSKKLAIGVEHMAELAMVQLKTVLDAYMQSDAETAKVVRARDAEIDRPLHLALPRAADLHDGRSPQHHVLRASPVLRQEHRAHRRSRDQYRRERPLHDYGPAAHRRAPARR